eukprot:TRINITY_DN37529_c0_g1_i1.p2 TRINITY_DN37529_c0_g1~~TRINITY_DN37529_c0_g1_i1.p2  ORF type:complete len:276 (+),score=119.27 TRINITY_DN37529_c0_g1_i1:301-1128(+)
MPVQVAFPDDFAVGTPMENKKTPYKTCSDFNFIKTEADFATLKSGSAFYGFNCAVGTSLGQHERTLIQSVINLSTFKEGDADFVPDLDLNNTKELQKFTYMLNKAMYVLPGLRISDLSPELVASVPFQQACQPGACKVWEDCPRKDTFRLTKTIIRAIYKVTIQFRCSWVPEEYLEGLSLLSQGLPVHKAIVLERTKRDTTVTDSTYKVRSVLLYHELKSGGVIVTNFTCIANTSVPSVVARVVDSLGWAGASEVAETAVKTRAYLVALKKKGGK